MRFLHTSDWHLGRIFHGIHLTVDQAYVLGQFIDLMRDTRPDAVVIAGDVYDRAVPPTEAVQLLDDVLSRILLDYGTPVMMIAGNHDSPERLGFGTRLLARQGLFVFGQLTGSLEPVVLHDVYGPVYFLPLPYAEPAVVRERLGVPEAGDHDRAMQGAVGYFLDKVPPRARTVAVAHAFTAGGEQSESERPLSVGAAGTVNAAVFQPFCYTALGHLHGPQWVGNERIRYAGSLLKYSFAEAGHSKGVNLVEIDGAGNISVETLALSPRRDVRCIEGFLEDILQGPRAGENREDYIKVILRDAGAILDVVGRLREVYPHVLDIDRPHLTSDHRRCGPGADYRQLTEVQLFAAFFEQVTDQLLTGEQAAEFALTVEETYRREREVAP